MGLTKDDRFDSNDHLTVPVPLDVNVSIRLGSRVITTQVSSQKKEQLVDLQSDF
jgi:hypothetical protein